MRKIFILLSIVYVFTTCSKEPNSESLLNKGLVSFKSKPTYLNEKVSFKAQIQFTATGKPVDIEYKIMYNTLMVISGKTNASISDGIINMFFETAEISVPISKSIYSGKTITIWLDPDLKITLPSYKGESYDAFRKEEIVIP